MAEVVISADRARGISRVLYVALGLAAVLVLVGGLLLGNGYRGYSVVVLLVAVALGWFGWRSLQALRTGSPAARRTCIFTGVLLLVLSVPLVPILVGLLTAVTGIGLLVVVLAPEHDAS